jgi:hypothetical protein
LVSACLQEPPPLPHIILTAAIAIIISCATMHVWCCARSLLPQPVNEVQQLTCNSRIFNMERFNMDVRFTNASILSTPSTCNRHACSASAANTHATPDLPAHRQEEGCHGRASTKQSTRRLQNPLQLELGKLVGPPCGCICREGPRRPSFSVARNTVFRGWSRHEYGALNDLWTTRLAPRRARPTASGCH